MPAHATRPRTAPVHPRRVSGPSRRPALAGPAIPHRSRTSAFERLGRLPDHRIVDRVLRSRGCIWLIGLMLGGIVAMQVSLLRLNAGISRAVQTQTTLEQQNQGLQSAIAKLSSGERVRAAAAADNMVDPQAGDTRYLTVRGERDAVYAARRMKPPSARAKAIMGNGGRLPGALAQSGTPVVSVNSLPTPETIGAIAEAPPATDATATPAATATPPPVATATPPAATVTPPPASTATPPAAVSTAVPESAADPTVAATTG
jgi:hypothetical protein